MENINHGTVFSDWLAISYAASSSPVSQVLGFLEGITSVHEKPSGRNKTIYRVSDVGTLKVTHEDHYHNLSFSGGVLAALRRLPLHRDFLISIMGPPSNVTRLDVSIDLPVPGHTVLAGIDKRHPDGVIEVAGHPRQLQFITDAISGTPTGTVYCQHKGYSGYVFIRVYDKAKEVLDRTGEKIPPTTRYEITVKKGASLRDYTNPESLFWHYMPETILAKPKGKIIAPWSPTERVDYDSKSMSNITDYEALRSLIQTSFSTSSIVDTAKSINGGPELVIREIKQMLGI